MRIDLAKIEENHTAREKLTTLLEEEARLRAARLAALKAIRDELEKWAGWRKHWPVIEVLLAACATLVLENVKRGLALFLVGESGVSKSTVLEMFMQARVVVWMTEFSDASLQSTFRDKNSSREEIEESALAKMLQHRVLLVPEGGTQFAGDKNSLNKRFTRYASWLDGGGVKRGSGTYAPIGEGGDKTFVWLMGRTPIEIPEWRTMAKLATRFLMRRAVNLHGADRVSAADYSRAQHDVGMKICAYLDLAIPPSRVRTRPWPTISAERSSKICELAALCAAGQTFRSNLGEDAGNTRPGSGQFEYRLTLLAAGNAEKDERSEVDDSDIAVLKAVVRSSMPNMRGPVLVALWEGADTAPKIVKRTGLRQAAVDRTLKELQQVEVVAKEGVMQTDEPGRPPAVWKILPPPDDPWDEVIEDYEPTE